MGHAAELGRAEWLGMNWDELQRYGAFGLDLMPIAQSMIWRFPDTTTTLYEKGT